MELKITVKTYYPQDAARYLQELVNHMDDHPTHDEWVTGDEDGYAKAVRVKPQGEKGQG